MDHFVVSARKYRPSTFETVVGQSSITTTLKNAIRNKHLAQAFLFCGPRGVGKTTCARILAKTINCTNLTPDTEGCNQCESCVSFNNGQSLNIFELDAASNNTVDDIRNLVEQVRYPPHSGQFKIYIIDEVHMLSTAAFNAFLKTLEEPPPYAIFILATTEKHKIIPTILSRCQIFDFNRITIDDIASHLGWIASQEGVKAEPEALHTIAQKADGALRDALSIFDQIVSFAGDNVTYKHVIDNLNILDYDYYFRLTDLLLQGNYPETLLLLDEVVSEGFEIHHFILGLGNHFRDLLVSRDPATTKLLEVGPATRDRYKSQAAQCSPSLLYSWLHLANRCDVEFKSVQNQRLHLEVALLKMCAPAAGLEKQEAAAGKPAAAAAAGKPVAAENQAAAAAAAAGKPAAAAAAAAENQAAAAAAAAGSSIDKPDSTTTTPTTAAATAAAAHTTTAAPNTASKSRPSTLSINKKLASMKEPAKTVEVSTEETVGETSPFVALDESTLIKSWKALSEKIRSEGRMQLAVTLSSQSPALSENNLIVLPVMNEIQAEEVKNAKQEIVQFLRTASGIRHIDVVARVMDTGEASETAYTPLEKFKKMAEKNPDLNQLRQQFDLELDF